jgi:hypothetical protein
MSRPLASPPGLSASLLVSADASLAICPAGATLQTPTSQSGTRGGSSTKVATVISQALLAFVAVTLAAAVVLATYALAEARARKRISHP